MAIDESIISDLNDVARAKSTNRHVPIPWGNDRQAGLQLITRLALFHTDPTDTVEPIRVRIREALRHVLYDDHRGAVRVHVPQYPGDRLRSSGRRANCHNPSAICRMECGAFSLNCRKDA